MKQNEMQKGLLRSPTRRAVERLQHLAKIQKREPNSKCVGCLFGLPVIVDKDADVESWGDVCPDEAVPNERN